jgi:hypothetical protein
VGDAPQPLDLGQRLAPRGQHRQRQALCGFRREDGFDGVLVEGWNQGWDGDWIANGEKFSFTKAYPDFDARALAAYAREGRQIDRA